MNNNSSIMPVDAHKVELNNSFITDKMSIVAEKLIPYQWEALNDRIEGAEPSYCIRNFMAAAGRIDASHAGCVFQDSDLYKWMEAASNTLVYKKDAALEKTLDEAIELIAAAQQPDGYINTYYTINGLDKRWTNLMNNHELYCAGHLIEAAVAHKRTTGKTAFVDIASKLAAHIYTQFGTEDGKKKGYPGHEVIEMALCALYEETGDEKQLELARYFINQRGQAPSYFEEESSGENRFLWGQNFYGLKYYQADIPVREQREAEGHAVRAGYLYCGMADVARLTSDETLKESCKTLFDNIVEKQMYITGSVGQSSMGEAFTFDYDLPNALVYGETCAAISMAFFAERMLKSEPKGIYADIIEKQLYNGALSGMSLDGTGFFYVNPLESWPERNERNYQFSHVKSERQKWFGCACCPPNLGRFIASMPGHVWSTRGDTAYLNLISRSNAAFEVGGGEAAIRVDTDYPWDGKVTIGIDKLPEGTMLAVHIPGWCAKYSISGADEARCEEKDGYLYISGVKAGDEIRVDLDMPVRVVRARPDVAENAGKAALMRGPIVYCAEEADNGKQLWNLYLSTSEDMTVQHSDDLGGVNLVTAGGFKATMPDIGASKLYTTDKPVFEKTSITFVPYYAWNNRGKGEMCVWIKEK